jgi:predicted RNase H-like nuclease
VKRVYGVDGCRGGWIAVAIEGKTHSVRFVRRLAELLDDAPSLIAIDMPMGFLDEAVPGGRACERAARAALPGKSSSVFSAPCRAALAFDEYRDALAANRIAHGVGLSKQSFNLFAKMRELDAICRATPPCRIVEAHPELGFARLAGSPVLESKKSAAGRALRLRLLDAAGLSGVGAWFDRFPRRDVAIDDIVDAACVATVANRIASGAGECLPPHPPKDRYGIEMAVWR